MSFNQWLCGKQIDSDAERAFEAAFDELQRLGCASAARLLTDIYEAMNVLADEAEDFYA